MKTMKQWQGLEMLKCDIKYLFFCKLFGSIA